MPSEITTATPDWNALQGIVLDGGYEITDCLLTNPASASFKVRVLGDRFMQAVVNVFTADAAPLEQYTLWQEALELRHSNISAPIAVGKLQHDASSYPYVVLHKADENLAGVIADRPLTSTETRELLRGVGAGLEHLHANGFVHSALAPEHILALGDSIRISSTSIRRINTPVEEGEPEVRYLAPESRSENLTVAADTWCLGATLFEVLTQQKCDEDCRERVKLLPAPFDWLVERCLDPEPHERPTFSELFAILSGGLKRPEPKPEPVPAPAPAVMAAAAGASSFPSASASTSASTLAAPLETTANLNTTNPVPPPPSPRTAKITPRPVTPAPRTAAPRPSEFPRPKLASSPKPVFTGNRPRSPKLAPAKPLESPRIKFLSYAFLAIVLAGGLLWLARPKPERPRPSVNPVAAAQTQTAAPATQTAPPPAVVVPSPPTEVWRVVVFTFERKEDADKRAKTLGQQHPGFNPEVFSSTGSAPFLVVLGGGSLSGGSMTRDQANRLRQKARASGFPRDSYILNFKH